MRQGVCGALLLALACSCWACEARAVDPKPSEEAAPAAPAVSQEAPTAAKEEPAGQVAELDLVKLREQGKLRGLEVVEARVLEDPAFKAPGRFRGYRLEDVLALLPGYAQVDWSRHELRMIASDGYTIPVPREKLTAGKGVLAFEDLEAPEGQAWRSFQQGKKTLTPAPFYLVWDQIPYGPSHPWPYQLERIALVRSQEVWAAAEPRHAPEVQEGFALFKARCISCHSVNLVGGKLGPELNVPRNITSYRRREVLAGFIRSASSYRARTAMPDFSDLEPGQVDKILAYLEAMGQVKICDSAQSCAAR